MGGVPKRLTRTNQASTENQNILSERAAFMEHQAENIPNTKSIHAHRSNYMEHRGLVCRLHTVNAALFHATFTLFVSRRSVQCRPIAARTMKHN